MKALGIAVIVVILVVVVVMLLAGGEHGPGRHTATDDAGAQTPASSGQATAGAIGEPAEAGEADRTISLTTLDTMVFQPSSTKVSAGETVTFRVTNTGQVAHEFTLGDAVMQQEHADAMAHMPDGMAHDVRNAIRVQPGETKELTWRFGHTGTLEYACHEPGHFEAGMRGQITVT